MSEPRTAGHPGCYAAALGGCSTTLSREHYFSEGILRLLSGGGPVSLSGFSWLAEGQVKDLPVNAVAAKILCETHNNSLSPLDDEALVLFQAWERMYEEFSRPAGSQPPRHERVEGILLERWLLKVLCGCVTSGVVPLPDAVGVKWQIPLNWLQVLFGVSPMAEPTGLYLLHLPGYAAEVDWSIGFEAFERDGDLAGVRLLLNRLHTALYMVPPVASESHRVNYRPEGIAYYDTTGRCRTVVDFGWVGGGVQRVVFRPA